MLSKNSYSLVSSTRLHKNSLSYVAGIIVFGIVIGCLFRGLYLLNDIHKRILTISPKKDKVQEALENHLKEREKGSF